MLTKFPEKMLTRLQRFQQWEGLCTLWEYCLTRCAALPQRSRTTSRMVWQLGALRLIWMAMMPNSMICSTAPAEYLCQKQIMYMGQVITFSGTGLCTSSASLETQACLPACVAISCSCATHWQAWNAVLLMCNSV